MAPVGLQLSSSSPLFLPCSSWKQASAETAPRSPTLLSAPHCSLHFAKHPREKSSAFPPPADPVDAAAAARRPWTGPAPPLSSVGFPIVLRLFKYKTRGAAAIGALIPKDYFMLFYHFRAPRHFFFFFFLHVRNEMVICWIIKELGRIFSGS